MTEIELHDCHQCDVNPGERHEDGCSIARCSATGIQHLQCAGELHEYKGHTYGEHEGDCKPSIWHGEYPGKAECRELGWYSKLVPGQGWVQVPAARAGEEGVSEDLNRLLVQGEWDPETERFVVRESSRS